MVTSLTVTFSEEVVVDAGAIEVLRQGLGSFTTHVATRVPRRASRAPRGPKPAGAVDSFTGPDEPKLARAKMLHLPANRLG